jgi:hypothetical protein
MDQDPNASSASLANTAAGAFQDNATPTYQMAMQAQIMQWVAAMQNPYATQLQNSSFPQQLQHPSLQNGIIGMSPTQQGSPLNHAGTTLPAMVTDDVFRMIYPVGSSPNDDSILAQALHDSAMGGKTYRQAIEGLHGVRRVHDSIE